MSLIFRKPVVLTWLKGTRLIKFQISTFGQHGYPALTGSTTQFLIRTTDRKSTRLNSSHVSISYAVFCLKKKINRERERARRDEGAPIRARRRERARTRQHANCH